MIFLFLISGLKSISRRITNDDRILSKRALRKELIENKRSELISSEKTNAVITSELYWKYDQYCRDNNYTFVSTWGVWLDKYRDTCSKQFKKFQDNNRERGRLCDARDSRKHSLVSNSRGSTYCLQFNFINIT